MLYCQCFASWQDKKFIKIWQPNGGLVQYSNTRFVGLVGPTVDHNRYAIKTIDCANSLMNVCQKTWMVVKLTMAGWRQVVTSWLTCAVGELLSSCLTNSWLLLFYQHTGESCSLTSSFYFIFSKTKDAAIPTKDMDVEQDTPGLRQALTVAFEKMNTVTHKYTRYSNCTKHAATSETPAQI